MKASSRTNGEMLDKWVCPFWGTVFCVGFKGGFLIVWAKQALHLMNESHVTARFLDTTSAWQSAWLRFAESLRRERMLAREPWLS